MLISPTGMRPLCYFLLGLASMLTGTFILVRRKHNKKKTGGFNQRTSRGADNMNFPLSFWDMSLWLAVNSIILLITSELLSPYYGRTRILINRKKLRNTAIITCTLFLITLAIRIYSIITTT